MTPELYRRASDLFNELRELPAGELAAALDSVCGGDGELRAQVVRMLEADRQAASGSFLGRRALEDAAQLLGRDSLDLPLPGTVLGKYRLGTRIGAGGMGVVFEAHDLRLDRRVAVKVLPLDLVRDDKEWVQRFRREARADSLLNHPNMVSIFDADFSQDWCYIAMEFVEGKTLRQLMAPEARPVHPKRILDWLSQAAAALSAAHKAGIVHRDIKPENIMVRDDDFVKVLDFGLAKLRESGKTAADGSDLRTRTGTLAGTIQYLSPEQILGEQAGPRSDLFSLGVVAYELATGVRPFDGPTDGAVFNRILNHTPPLPSTVSPSLGGDLDAVIMRLLEKDPELRFQTASDLRSSCRRLGRDSISIPIREDPGNGRQNSTGAFPGTPAGRKKHWHSIGAIVGVVCALSAGFLWLAQPLPTPRVNAIVQITHDGAPKEYFVNDGARLYYAVANGNSGTRMFQMSTRNGDPVPMPQLANMFPLDISADGSELLLGQSIGEGSSAFPLWVAATLGGTPRRIGDLTATDARWSPKGDRILYSAPPGLRIAHGDGSESRVLATLGGYLTYPAWSPDGRSIRYTLEAKNALALWEVTADGGHPHPLLPNRNDGRQEQGAWTPDGRYFVFSAEQTTRDIWVLPQNRRLRLRMASSPVRLTRGPLIADRPQSTPDGHKILFRGRLDRGELVRYDHKTEQWNSYLPGLQATQIDYSRDGKWITYVSYPDACVWRCASDGSERLQLSTPPMIALNPRWSPDGTQIVFFGGAPGKPSRVYVVSATGGAVRQLTHGEAGAEGDQDASWSPDGAFLVFCSQEDEPSEPQGSPLRMINLKTGQVWLYSMATHQRRQLTNLGASWPSWSRNSQSIYFGNNRVWYRVRISDGKTEPVATLRNLKTADRTWGWIGLTPDNSLISTRNAGNTEIYALDWETP